MSGVMRRPRGGRRSPSLAAPRPTPAPVTLHGIPPDSLERKPSCPARVCRRFMAPGRQRWPGVREPDGGSRGSVRAPHRAVRDRDRFRLRSPSTAGQCASPHRMHRPHDVGAQSELQRVVGDRIRKRARRVLFVSGRALRIPSRAASPARAHRRCRDIVASVTAAPA